MLGNALGGLSDVMSAPARGLRTLLGMPETGTHFTEGMGLDPDSLATSAVGFGYDMLTDPLTYLGGALGRLGGRALGRAGNLAERAAPAAQRVDQFAGSGLQKAMAKPLYDHPGNFAFGESSLRSHQLNSPFFRPDMPVFNLGTPQFSQVAGEAPLLEGLATERFLGGVPPPNQTLMSGLPGDRARWTRVDKSGAFTSPAAEPNALTSRLERMLAPGATSPVPVQSRLIREPGLAQPLTFEPSLTPSFNPGPMPFDPDPSSSSRLLERLMQMTWPAGRVGARSLE